MIVQSLWKGQLYRKGCYARRVLAEPPLIVRQILKEVARRHGVTHAELTGDDKTRRVAWARHEAMHEIRELRRADGGVRFSLPQIGAWLGFKDHSTVLYGVRAYKARMLAA